MTESFYSRYNLSPAAELGSTTADLLRYLESLNREEWVALVDALLQRRADALDVFRPSPGEEPIAAAARCVEQLGQLERQNFCRAVERLLRAAKAELKGSEEATASDRLRKAFRLTSVVADPPLIGVLEDLARDTHIPVEIRVGAANSLANHPMEVPDGVWLSLKLNELPELAPAVVNGLALRAPIKGLRALAGMTSAPALPETLEYPLRRTFRRLAQEAGGLRVLGEVYATVPPWLRQVMDVVLSFEEFSSLLPQDALWEPAVASWHPAIDREEADSRLLEMLPEELPRSVLTRLLALFTYPPSEDGFTPQVSKLLWRRIVQSEPMIALAATSTDDPDRRLFEVYIQSLRRACRDPWFGAEALKLRVRYSLSDELPDVVREALDEDHITVSLCWSLLEGKLGRLGSDRVFSTVIRRLAPDAQIDSQEPFEEAEQKIARRLYSFKPALFRLGDNIGEVPLLILKDETRPLTSAGVFNSYLQ